MYEVMCIMCVNRYRYKAMQEIQSVYHTITEAEENQQSKHYKEKGNYSTGQKKFTFLYCKTM